MCRTQWTKALVLKHLPESARRVLIHIYNATIDLHYTPLLWRNAEVVFLPKPGKDDYTDRRAFRPILLMPLFFKALERLVQWCMDATALPLDKEQHAFRKGHCTEGALSRLLDTVERALHHIRKELVVYLDIKGAFDNLNSGTIAQGMVEHGVEEEVVNWFEGYFQSRYCSVKGSDQHYKLVKGTGQGGVLSPIVWNFVMDSFLAAYSDHAAMAISYADDWALIITCTDLETARTQMQFALGKAQAWADRVGLEFSAAKSKAMIFSKKKSRMPRLSAEPN
jgi:hypothetical protein